MSSLPLTSLWVALDTQVQKEALDFLCTHG